MRGGREGENSNFLFRWHYYYQDSFTFMTSSSPNPPWGPGPNHDCAGLQHISWRRHNSHMTATGNFHFRVLEIKSPCWDHTDYTLHSVFIVWPYKSPGENSQIQKGWAIDLEPCSVCYWYPWRAPWPDRCICLPNWYHFTPASFFGCLTLPNSSLFT